LGRKDPLTGEIIDTKNTEKSIPVQSYDFGVTYFCKNIISKLGLDILLKNCISEKKEMITTLVEYLVSDGGAYYLAEQWAEGNFVEIKPKNISSQRISQYLKTLVRKQRFEYIFLRNGKKNKKKLRLCILI